MFGLDDRIASFSDGATLPILVVVAILLGLRHASDPDHLAAVTTLVASKKERTTRLAAKLGFAWGLGHATSLFAFGVPIVLFRAYLPEAVLRFAETLIGLVIVGLAVWLLVRWRRGVFHADPHQHSQGKHQHLHSHVAADTHEHRHTIRSRSPLQAYAIGLVHGMGGSAGVGILLLASIQNQLLAVAALGLFAFFTAVSMALMSSGLGLTLGNVAARGSFNSLAPVLGTMSLAFGVWYALGAQNLVPYVF
jgi:ABC-type nickel/cobalt efflux system permease component RcnA